MRLVFGLVLVAGVGLAGTAAYMAKNRIGQYQDTLAAQQAQLAGSVELTKVYISKSPIGYGQKITKDVVVAVDWPVNAIPKGAFQNEDDLFALNGELRHAVRVMEPGEAIMKVKVTEPGREATIASRLSPGMRAFTISVNDTSGVAGFLRPGSWVDVTWTGNAGGGVITKIIESNLKIIAINQSANIDVQTPIRAKTVTVATTPERVAALTLAQSQGRLSLSLRGEGDTSVADNDFETDLDTVLRIEREVVVEEEEKKICYQTERKGTETTKTEVPCPIQ